MSMISSSDSPECEGDLDDLFLCFLDFFWDRLLSLEDDLCFLWLVLDLLKIIDKKDHKFTSYNKIK